MNQRSLGASGLKVSEIGLGCNNFGGGIDMEASRHVIDRAIELGVTLFDTADVYGNLGGSEEVLGQVLRDRRDSVVLATKFAGRMGDSETSQGGSRRYIQRAVEASLRRLQTDRIDLYQMHWYDDTVPIQETLTALDDLVKQGKVLYIGCSNYRPWQVVDAQWTAKQSHLTPFISCQDEYSLIHRDLDKDMLPMMQRHGLGLLPYSPLASGLLTGKYTRGGEMPEGARITNSAGLQDRFFTESTWAKVEGLSEFAKQRGHSLLELAFAWLLSKPPVACVIAGATKPEQVQQNCAAAAWVLTPEDQSEIDKITGSTAPP